MVHPRTGERDSALVTTVTRRTGHDMPWRLANRNRSRVTGCACGGDAAVIQPRAGECGRALVTTVTGRVGHEMPWRLSNRNCSRVTGCACGGDAAVIQPRAGERGRALVTALTWCSGRNVSCGFADGDYTRMTRGACGGDAAVIQPGTGERGRAPMAILARRVGHHMFGRLAECVSSIVTPRAPAARRGMTKPRSASAERIYVRAQRSEAAVWRGYQPGLQRACSSGAGRIDTRRSKHVRRVERRYHSRWW